MTRRAADMAATTTPAGAMPPRVRDALLEIRCPNCDHLLAKVAPAPGVMVSLQCRTCKRLVVYCVPTLSVLREIIARAELAAGRA